MNRFLIYIFSTIIITFVSCERNNDNKIDPSDIKNPYTAKGIDEDVKSEMPVLSFEKDFHDFGKVVEGVTISYSFKYTNTGNSDLIIHTIKTNCGCTASEYTKEPIAPGKSGIVKLTFDSNGRVGRNTKTATIVSNTQPNVHTLRINAEVIKAGEF